jgi:hypothetical protein
LRKDGDFLKRPGDFLLVEGLMPNISSRPGDSGTLLLRFLGSVFHVSFTLLLLGSFFRKGCGGLSFFWLMVDDLLRRLLGPADLALSSILLPLIVSFLRTPEEGLSNCLESQDSLKLGTELSCDIKSIDGMP